MDENKTELFRLLSLRVTSFPTEGKAIYANDRIDALCSLADADIRNRAPCFHKEADTLLLLHVADVLLKRYKNVCVHTGDTNVVVFAIAMFNRIKPDELWVAFGTGSYFRYIPAHKIAFAMDSRICATLPDFHAFTGCNTVSSYGGKGKKTTWNTWQILLRLLVYLKNFN